MDPNQLYLNLPGADPAEIQLLQSLSRGMSEAQQQQFLAFYQGKRKTKNELLLYTLLGFVLVAGIQRFVVGDVVLGVLYLLTGGFCGIGTIVDLINLGSMTRDYNHRQAVEAVRMVGLVG